MKYKRAVRTAVTAAAALYPAASWATSSAVTVETVSLYTSCFGCCDLPSCAGSGDNFMSAMTANGTGWDYFRNFKNNDVWDRDFLDPDTGAIGGTDGDAWDAPDGVGISFFCGHGTCDWYPASDPGASCDAHAQCNAAGMPMPSVCVLPPVIEGPRGGGVRAHRLAGSAAVGAGPLDTVQVA